MNKEAARKFFLESILKERAYLFGQTGQVILTEHGKESVTADGKRACWTQISLRLIRAGANHYRGKSTEDLRAIFADMKRRTLNKLRRFEEVLTGREKMDNSMRLNERDNLILDIIGRESLPPTLQAMIERGELPLMDDNGGAATTTSNFVQQQAKESEEQQQLQMDRLKQEWEDFARHQHENNHNLEMTSGSAETSTAVDRIAPDFDGTSGLLQHQQQRKRQRIDGPEEVHDDDDDHFGDAEVEEDEGGIEEEEGKSNDDNKAIRKAKLRFYESQCQLVQEQIALAKAQRVEAELRAELLRMQLGKEKEQQQKQEKMASNNGRQSIKNMEKSAMMDSCSASTMPESMKIPAATSASMTTAAAPALWMLDCGELVEQLMHTFLEQTNQRALSNSSIDFLNGLRAQREKIAKEANVETFLNKFDAFLEEQRNAVVAAESRRSKTAIAIMAVGLQLVTKREQLLVKHMSSSNSNDNNKQTMSAG